MNGLRHRFRSKAVLLPGEEAAEFEAFCGEIMESRAPVGVEETEIVIRLAGWMWRARRAALFETSLYMHHELSVYASYYRFRAKRFRDRKIIRCHACNHDRNNRSRGSWP